MGVSLFSALPPCCVVSKANKNKGQPRCRYMEEATYFEASLIAPTTPEFREKELQKGVCVLGRIG